MNPVTHVVSKFLQKVHTKQLATLQRQTQQLDPERRDYLRTVLQNGNSNSNNTCADPLDDHRNSSTNSSAVVGEQDLEEQTTTTTQSEDTTLTTTMMLGTVDALHRAIVTAEEQQQALAARRSFLQTRLAVYDGKLRGLEHQSSGGGHNTTTTTKTTTTSQLPTTTTNTPPTKEQEHLLCQTTPRRRRRRTSAVEDDTDTTATNLDDVGVREVDDDDNPTMRQRQTQLASYRRALIPIRKIITNIETEWHTNQVKLEAMQLRHWDLQVKTEECNIVRNELFSRTNDEHSRDHNNNNDNDNDTINYNTTAKNTIHDSAFHDENPTRATATAIDNSIRNTKSYESDAEYRKNDGVVLSDLELV